MSGSDGVWQLVVVVFFVVGTIVGVGGLMSLAPPGSPESYNLAQGTQTVSDGHIAITVDGSYVEPVPRSQVGTPFDLYLIVNLTFANVDGSNTSIGAGWFVNATWNGTYVSNTWFGFTGAYAKGQLPIPFTLAPGQKVSGWLAFYLQPPTGTSSAGAVIRLEKVLYYEHFYGGRDTGDGGWIGGHDLWVRFEILPA